MIEHVDYEDMSLAEKTRYYEFLSQFVSENKKSLFESVSLNRTRYLTVVMENIFQSQNASAVLRSCDLFGVQDIHIIENNNKYTLNKDVALGSSKWLSMNKYNSHENNTKQAYDHLRKNGYRIVATSPHAKGCLLDDLPLNDGKIALVFGTELEGLSDYAIENADEYVTIPMYGFTESFNISVSAAISMHHLIEKIHRTIPNWRLSDIELVDVKTQWVKRVLKKHELYDEKYFLSKK